MKTRFAALVAACMLLAATLPARAETHNTLPDLLEDWLDVQEEAPVAWGEAWLRYEASYSRWLDQTFYAEDTPTEKSAQIDQALSADMPDFSKRMQELGELATAWPGEEAAMQAAFQREFGRAPGVEVYLDYAMADQALSTRDVDGHPALSLNARFLLPYEPSSLRMKLARLLAPCLWAGGSSRQASAPEAPAAQLYTEGVTAWACSLLVPQAALESVLEVSPGELASLKAGQAHFARELAGAIDSADPAKAERFFGEQAPAGWPPKAGRYLGLLAVRQLARECGQATLLRMDTKTFAQRVKPILKQLGGQERPASAAIRSIASLADSRSASVVSR